MVPSRKTRRLFGRFGVHQRMCGGDRLHNVMVTGATAQVTFQTLTDFLLRETVRMRLHKVDGGHDHAGGTESALQCVMFPEHFLHRMQRSIRRRQTLDCDDIRTIRLQRKLSARLHGNPVHMHHARAALAGVAADMRAGETKLFAQQLDKQGASLDVDRVLLAVNRQRDLRHRTPFHGVAVSTPRAAKGLQPTHGLCPWTIPFHGVWSFRPYAVKRDTADDCPVIPTQRENAYTFTATAAAFAEKMIAMTVRASILALTLLTAPAARAQTSGINDYPTAARAEYVFACMTSNGQTQEALTRCACAIDTIAAAVPYDAYEKAETILRMRHEGGGYLAQEFRVTASNNILRQLQEAQAEADVSCF
jgi:hypothetical protein